MFRIKSSTKTFLAVLIAIVAAAGFERLLRADVPHVPSNFWAPTGDMAGIRAGASGTLLADGHVLVAGGIDADGATAAVERFSPSGGGFFGAPSMQTSRANHTATLLADGRVLVVGGTGAIGTAEASAEIYDPSIVAWLPAGPLNVARRGHTATLLSDGKVLVAGGDDGGQAIDTLEIFDPATEMFSVVDGALNGARTLHAAAALLDGRVLLAGGYDGANPIATTSLYDPETGTVIAGPDLSTPRSGLTATTLLDGRVLIAGGAGPSGELASAEVFDPSTNTLTATDNTLAAERQNHLAFLLPHNNQVLIVGGLAGGSPVAAAEYFTPWEGTNGTFCAELICASGYVGPAVPGVARAWASGSALSFPASETVRSGPADGLLMLAGGSGQQSAELFGFATVKTDKEDYSPGQTVTITGSGWQPEEWVTLVLREYPLLDEHPLEIVRADADGNIESTEFVPDEHDIGIRFYLTAYGQQSQAQTTFTDGSLSAAPLLIKEAGCGSNQASFSTGDTVCASTTVTVMGGGSDPNVRIQWFRPDGTLARDTLKSSVANGSTQTDTLALTGLNAATGTWTVKTCKGPAGACSLGNTMDTKTFTVGAANIAPTANAGSVNTNEDTALDITLSGSDTGTCELTFSIVSGPSHGSLGSITNSACTPASPNTDTASVTYTPVANYNGSDSFTYRVNDGSLDSLAATASITVNSVNDAPSFSKGADQAVLEDAAAQSVTNWATALSNGPADESGQVLDFIVTNDNNALFSAQPVVSASGTLSYTPAANASGSASVTVQIHDNGGTANGGVDTSASQIFTITVTAVNDEPAGTSGSATTNEDTDLVYAAANFGFTDPDDSPDNNLLAVKVTTLPVAGSLTLNGAPLSPGTFVSKADIDAGKLKFSPVADANGSPYTTFTFQVQDDGGVADGGIDLDASPNTLTINVTAVNDVPSFTKGADQTVAEDSGAHSVSSWATAISAGPADEAGQTVDFVIDSNSNAALFAVPPAVSSTGTLTYTPAADANGSATITLHSHDDGGVLNGGVDASATQTFTITVTAVNDVPSFTKGVDQSVLEDAGAQSVGAWATAISAGPANESEQALNFIVSNDNNGLFSTQPSISPSGTLSYTPAADSYGSATVTVQIHDDGGTANGGVDTSAAQMFTITVTPVNDVPSFTVGANQSVIVNSGAKTVVGWATGISAGPANESEQTLNFIVSNNNNPLFSVQPTISANGTLTFTPALNAAGSAIVTVQVHDDGGIANGGVDTSAAQTFTITVLYSTSSCLGSPGHTILQPINPDGTSVFKQKSTVPAKFRVCDANGVSIGTPGVVGDFRLVQVISVTATDSVNEPVDSTTPDMYFRWSATDQQWIFNVNTKGWMANKTYVFRISLNDSSIIQFQLGLK